MEENKEFNVTKGLDRGYMVGKIGRNDPCSCGSGKKYKNCCLQKEQEQKKGMSTPLGKRKFTAKVLSAAGVPKPSQEQVQSKSAVDYNTLMERSFGNAIHTGEKPPLPSDPTQYLVEEKDTSST